MAVFPIIAAMALGSTGAEPVVWTKMADPDPTYVEPKPSRKRKSPRAAHRNSEPTDMAGAIVNLARAGQEAQAAALANYEQKLRELRDAAERSREAAEESSSPQR